jgi:PII-like signaling protein
MKAGYEIIFITPQNRRHQGKLVVDLIVETAQRLGIARVTKRADSEGTGAGGAVHSAHFFELADQPVEVVFILDAATGERLVAEVEQADIPVFCIRKQVEYGELGKH